MNLWDIKARWYETIRHLFIISWILNKERDNITILINKEDIHPNRILDIGAGSGEAGSLFKIPVHTVAVDKSMNMLIRCRQKGFMSIKADAVLLPIRTGLFVCVVSIGLSEYIDNLDGFFSEAARVLQDDGYFISTRAPLNFYNILRNISGTKVRCYSEKEFLMSAIKKGFILKNKKSSFMQVQYLFQKK